MEHFPILLPLAVVLLPLLTLRGGESWPAARWWIGSWFVIYAAGLAVAFRAQWPDLVWITRACMPPFAAGCVAGALGFAGRARPRALVPIAVVGAVAVLAAGALAGSAAAAWVAGGIGVPLLLGAAWILRDHTREGPTSAPERGLVPAFCGLALLVVADYALRERLGADPVLLGAWVGVGLLTAVLQLSAFLDRARRGERDQRQERELLRQVALALGEPDPRAALARVATKLQRSNRFRWFGIWARSADRDHFELLEDRGGARAALPEGLRRYPVGRTELGRATLDAPGPFFLPEMADDPRVVPTARGPAVISPLRAGGEVVGVLAASIDPRAQLDDELRQFVRALSDEIALVLAAFEAAEQRDAHRRALEEERQVLRAMVDASPLGTLLVDGSGRVRLVNRRIGEHLGVADPATWVGRRGVGLLDLAGGSLSAESRRAVAAAAGSGEPPDGRATPELDVRVPGAEDRTLVVSVHPLGVDRDAASLGRVWLTRDVTAERRLAARLQQADRMQTLDTLAGGLAHDFNNQLTAILGNARLLADELPPGASARELLGDLERSAEHCADLTRGLLDFARQSPTTLAPVDVAAVLDEVASLLRPSLPPEASLDLEVDPRAGAVRADESQLRRVLTNLVVNARDAIGEQGRIRIAASRVDTGDDEWPEVQLEVSDDGAGMDAETCRRVFDPFFTTKAVGRGTGLGLSVVYGLVEAHGGSVEVESEPGKGTTFTLRWPASEPPERPVAGTAARVRARAGARPEARATVLVAEDEPGVRRLARTTLERAGYRVLEAHDGQEALDGFARHEGEIDLLVFDLSMPRRGGIEAIAEIRRRAPALRALVMSGHPDREDASGWPPRVELLPKPFGPDALLDRVERLLAREESAEGESAPGGPR